MNLTRFLLLIVVTAALGVTIGLTTRGTARDAEPPAPNARIATDARPAPAVAAVASTVRGTVSDGSPVAGASVWIRASADVNADLDEPDATTDERGAFEAAIDGTGPHFVLATAPGFAVQAVRIEGGNAPLAIRFGDASVRGRVLGPDGEPLGGVQVTVGADGHDADPARWTFGITTSEEDGTFAIGGFLAGAYRIVAEPDHSPGSDASDLARAIVGGVRIASGAENRPVDVELGHGATIRIRLAAADGGGVGDAEVRIALEGGSRCETLRADNNGLAIARGFDRGKVWIRAVSGTCVQREAATLDIEPGGDHEVELELVPSGGLLVRCERADGSAVDDPRDAPLTLIDPQGREVGGEVCDPDGDPYAFDALVPGLYTVRATFGRQTTVEPVQIDAGVVREVMLRQPE